MQQVDSTSAEHSLGFLDGLGQDTQGVVEGPLSLIQDLLGGAPKYNGTRLPHLHACQSTEK